MNLSRRGVNCQKWGGSNGGGRRTSACRAAEIRGVAYFIRLVAKISVLVLVRRLCARLVADDLPGRNHRRERAGGDRATRATSAPRIRRALSLRKASAREPQCLPRRRFPLSPPFGVTSPMKPRPRLAVRNLIPLRSRDDRLATAQTGSGRPVDEAIPNPGFDLLALVTKDGIGRRNGDDPLRLGDDGIRLRLRFRFGRNGMLELRRRLRNLALDAVFAATIVINWRLPLVFARLLVVALARIAPADQMQRGSEPAPIFTSTEAAELVIQPRRRARWLTGGSDPRGRPTNLGPRKQKIGRHEQAAARGISYLNPRAPTTTLRPANI